MERSVLDKTVSFLWNQEVKLCVVVSTQSRKAVCSLRRTDAQSVHMSWRGGPQVTGIYVQNKLTYVKVPASEGAEVWRGCDTTVSAY
jgi:hypothetical protein